MRLAGPQEPRTRSNYEANFRNHVEPVLGSRALRDIDAEAVAEPLAVAEKVEEQLAAAAL